MHSNEVLTDAALLAPSYYVHTNPAIVAVSRHAIAEVPADRVAAD